MAHPKYGIRTHTLERRKGQILFQIQVARKEILKCQMSSFNTTEKSIRMVVQIQDFSFFNLWWKLERITIIWYFQFSYGPLNDTMLCLPKLHTLCRVLQGKLRGGGKKREWSWPQSREARQLSQGESFELPSRQRRSRTPLQPRSQPACSAAPCSQPYSEPGPGARNSTKELRNTETVWLMLQAAGLCTSKSSTLQPPSTWQQLAPASSCCCEPQPLALPKAPLAPQAPWWCFMPPLSWILCRKSRWKPNTQSQLQDQMQRRLFSPQASAYSWTV